MTAEELPPPGSPQAHWLKVGIKIGRKQALVDARTALEAERDGLKPTVGAFDAGAVAGLKIALAVLDGLTEDGS